MKASQRIRIERHVSAGFDAVRDAFAENFSPARFIWANFAGTIGFLYLQSLLGPR
jgi:hypothetical protein